MSINRIILSAYDTSCQMKNVEKSMKKRDVNPENLEERKCQYMRTNAEMASLDWPQEDKWS